MAAGHSKYEYFWISKNRELSLDYFCIKRMEKWIGRWSGKNFEVLAPKCQQAKRKYIEWKFGWKNNPYLQTRYTYWHSLGGSFCQYLSEIFIQKDRLDISCRGAAQRHGRLWKLSLVDSLKKVWSSAKYSDFPKRRRPTRVHKWAENIKKLSGAKCTFSRIAGISTRKIFRSWWRNQKAGK